MARQRNGSLYLCRLRVSELEDDGTPSTGTDVFFCTGGVIKVDYELVVTEGQRVRQETGCGDPYFSLVPEDQIEGCNITVNLCTADGEYVGLMTGEPTITIDGQVVGNSLPAAGTELSKRVCVEGLAKAVRGNAQADDGAGNLVYWHYVWPSMNCREGNASVANAPFELPIHGKGQDNPNIGEGPHGDLPMTTGGTPVSQIPGAMARYQEGLDAMWTDTEGLGDIVAPPVFGGLDSSENLALAGVGASSTTDPDD